MSDSLLKEALANRTPEELLAALPPHLREYLPYCWEAWARPEQLLPDDKRICLLLAGRRFGKTRTAAEWVRRRVSQGIARNIMIVAPTHNDLLTDMLYGKSGLITIHPPGDKPHFKTTDNTLNWSNGARAICLSAEEPERTRGKEVDTVWCDEIAAWRYGEEIWKLIKLCIGNRPMRIVVTTTPKPTPLVRKLLEEAPHVVRGSTYENAANLDEEALNDLRKDYEGTRLGRQELHAEILTDVPGALWSDSILDACHVETAPVLRRVVVAVDPSGGHAETNDEQGIVVCGLGDDGNVYVLRDATVKLSPDGWGRAVINAYVQHSADRVVYEKNFGGEQVEFVIKTAARNMGVQVATKFVQASRGKVVRAEPIAALYEQGHVKHVGFFPELEDQMRHFTPSGEFIQSPDRVDALVWAVTELALHNHVTMGVAPIVSGVRRVDEQGPLFDGDDDEDEQPIRSTRWQRR